MKSWSMRLKFFNVKNCALYILPNLNIANMSNTFFAVLPSNTNGINPRNEPNRPNNFRIKLPKKIRFDGTWAMGLHSIVSQTV